jgi:3-oxoacyl-[acyl-carrier protein] reductase
MEGFPECPEKLFGSDGKVALLTGQSTYKRRWHHPLQVGIVGQGTQLLIELLPCPAPPPVLNGLEKFESGSQGAMRFCNEMVDNMQCADLRGKIVIVTGANRPRGIGAATCRAFAAQGCAIFFTAFSPDANSFPESPAAMDSENLVAELRSTGVPVGYMEIDLAQPDCAARVFDTAERLLGPVSILVNNAAHSAMDGFQKLDASGLDAHYAVNLRAAALLSVEFARRYSKGHGGRIINLTSGQEREPLPGELAYAATKGAVSAFTRSLAKEVAFKGIRVNAVDPGPTDTGWMSEQIKIQILSSRANGRVGLPEDAARLIVFLASEAAEQLSGEIIHARGI